MKEYLSIFISFFRIGLLTFGGGYSIMPMLRRETVEKHSWANESELLDSFAVSQCVPGVIAVNTALLIGYKIKKIRGALVAVFGVVLPSVIIILIIAALFTRFSDIPAVQNAMKGIRVAVAALIVSSLIKIIKTGVKNIPQIIIAVLSFVLVAVIGASPVYIIIGSALFGLCMFRIKPEKEGSE